jgi:hypothetical protein
LLTIALDRLPAGIVTAPAAFVVDSDDDDAGDMTPDTAANGATIKEGAYRLDETGRLTQIVDGLPRGSSRSSVVGRSPREAC